MRERNIATLAEELLFEIEPRRLDGLREGLQDTPERFARACAEWFSGYDIEPSSVMKTFEDGAENNGEMILLEGIPVFSHCEHHLAPFAGKATVAYIPDGRIIGLSKIPKLVNIFARRLQVQERLTTQIANALMEHLTPKGCGVIIRCEHFCMSTRGVHTPGVLTTTSALRGCFMDAAARAEFLSLTQ
jgi:GTP cyclohydrolase I